jgi:hypothetical protein
MKRLVNRILTVGIALAGVVAVHAQDKTVTANVPFSFYVGASAMPQGAYRVDGLLNGGVVCIRSKETEATKAITTMSVIGKAVDEPARLVFHRYGDVYFLSQIWTGAGPKGMAITRSKREKELARSGLAPVLAEIRLVAR